MATANKSNSLAIILIIVIILGLAVISWLWLIPAFTADNSQQPSPNKTSTSNNSATPDNHATTVYEYTSAKGEVIKITGIAKGDTITSPLTIKGGVRGSWSHEGTFTIDLVYGGEDWLSLGSATATLSGDWTTNDYVPFSATLTFSLPPASEDTTSGVLVIRNTNSSGLPANDDSVGIPVTF